MLVVLPAVSSDTATSPYCESFSFLYTWPIDSILRDIAWLTLASLEHGRKYVIDNVDASDPNVQRLMVLGLVEGAQIELASAAIGGDPIELRMFGNAISLRREQAQRFFVVLAESGE